MQRYLAQTPQALVSINGGPFFPLPFKGRGRKGPPLIETSPCVERKREEGPPPLIETSACDR